MQLKGKLFLSFGAVMLLGLSILGAIILYSFSENIKASGEEIIRLKTAIIASRAKMALHKPVESIYHALIPCLADHPQPHSFCSSRLTGEIEKIIVQNPLITGANLFSDRLPEPQFAAGPAPDKQLRLLVQAYDAAGPQLVSWSDTIYLLQRVVFSPDTPYVLAVELDATVLTLLFEDLLDIDQSMLILVDENGQSSLIIDHLRDTTISAPHMARLIESATPADTELDLNGYIYQYKDAFFGNRLLVFVNNAFFLKSLSALKNRIIAGILIVGWVLVWAILIVSHKISSPIRNLSKLTHDIAAFNYDTELQPTSKDEIGELTENFESMRRKIKGLIAKDPLTQVYNRRFLMHIFELATLKALRQGRNLSCIMMDLDFFKEINDKYGHPGGDAVLVATGKILMETTRDYDTPARFGGEEFLLVLPDTALEDAYTIAERIRKRAEEAPVEYNGHLISFTMSLGVAALVLEETDPVEKIINRADKALYQAKEQGRNRTVVFETT